MGTFSSQGFSTAIAPRRRPEGTTSTIAAGRSIRELQWNKILFKKLKNQEPQAVEIDQALSILLAATESKAGPFLSTWRLAESSLESLEELLAVIRRQLLLNDSKKLPAILFEPPPSIKGDDYIPVHIIGQDFETLNYWHVEQSFCSCLELSCYSINIEPDRYGVCGKERDMMEAIEKRNPQDPLLRWLVVSYSLKSILQS